MKEQNVFFFFFKTFFFLHNSLQLTSNEQNLVDYDLMHFFVKDDDIFIYSICIISGFMPAGV